MFGRKLKKQLSELQIVNSRLKTENEMLKKTIKELLSEKKPKKNQLRDSKGRFVKS